MSRRVSRPNWLLGILGFSVPVDNVDPTRYFKFSSVDNDPQYNDGTVVDKGNDKIQPVFDTATYLSFGMGYRRCPGEAFNYMFAEKMLQKFADLDFKFREVAEPCDPNHIDMSRYVAIAPRTAVFDNLFVKDDLIHINK